VPSTGQPRLIDIAPAVNVDPRTSRPARRAFVGTSPDSPPVQVCVFGPLEAGVDTDESSGTVADDPYEPFSEPAVKATPTAAEFSPSDLDDEQYANIVADLFSPEERLALHTHAKSKPAVAPAAVVGCSSSVPLLKSKAKDGGPAVLSASSLPSLATVQPAVVLASTSSSHPPQGFPRNPLATVQPMHRTPPPPPPPPPPAADSRGATGKGKGVPTHINTGFLNVVAQLYELRIPPT
jgi:hypothetical protein